MRQESKQYDFWLLFTALLLVAFGLVMVASSSMVISDKQFGYPFHYLMKQCVFLGMGLILAWVVTCIPVDVWRKYSVALLGIAILLLLIVLVPGLGRVVNGSRRWLGLGPLGFQVSEIAKLCAIIYLASYIDRFQNQVRESLSGFLKPVLLLGVIAVLLLLEPDFGTVVVLTAVFLSVLFLAGARLWPFLVLIVIVVVMLSLLAVLSPYRMARLTTFINPWHNAFGSGYQLTQSLIAFGRGGWLGVGLGNSVQKLFYLPEAHTDFIFAVISEELGFLGELCLLGLFAALIFRIFYIARQAIGSKLFFSGYYAYAVGLWIAFQVIVNVSVCSGLLPTKGLTLPFVSYGGSSLLINCIAVALVLRIAYESNCANFNTQSTAHLSGVSRRD